LGEDGAVEVESELRAARRESARMGVQIKAKVKVGDPSVEG